MPGPETLPMSGTPAEDEIRSTLERARRGDPAAVPALREALDRHPEIWRAYGDVAAHASDAWIGLAAGSDLALKESLDRRAAAMVAEVAGPSPSPLESLLAGRIVACWLQVGYSDAAATRVGDASVKQAEHARKSQDSAHRRYVTAIGALATVRKLLGAGVSPPDALPPGRSRMTFSGDEAFEARPEVGAVRLAIQDVDEGGP